MLSADSVARWSRQLDALHDRLAPHFARPEPRRRARAYLQTLLAGAERRSGNRRQPFVLAVKSSEPLFDVGLPGRSQPRAATIAAALPVEAWHVLSAGAGSKGPRAYRWAWTDLARLGWPGWRHALLVRESLKPNAKGEYEPAYYVVFAPVDVTLQEVVQVAGTRWAIEQGFETAKQEVGLDEYEVRQYGAWYRYITLALFAHAFLAVIRSHAAPRKKGTRGSRPVRRHSSR